MELTLDQALQKGIEAHKAGKVQEAERYYSAILKVQPKHPDANHNLGVLAIGIGKVKEALPFFKTALEANPGIAQYWLSYIDTLIKVDRIDDARAILNKARDRGAKGDGFNDLERRLSQVDILESEVILLNEAIEFRENGNFDESIELLEKGIFQFPKNSNFLALLAHCYILKDEFEEAERHLARAKAVDPNNALVGWNEARVLLKKKNIPKALFIAQTTNVRFPNDVEGLGVLGSCLKANGDVNESIKYLTKAIDLNPNYAEALINRGLIRLEQDDKSKALIDLQKAYTIKPYIKQIWGLIINLKMELEDFSGAISLLEEMIKSDANNEKMFANIAFCYQKLEQLDEAITAYKKSISIKPDYADAHYNLGAALQQVGKLEEAIKAYQHVISLKPDHADAFNNLGNTYKDQGQLDEAIDAYQKALNIKPNYAGAKHNLIELLKIISPDNTNISSIISIDRNIKLKAQKIHEEAIDYKLATDIIDVLGEIYKTDKDLRTQNSQIFRRNEIDLNCKRHMAIFETREIIPEFCFGCYKVQVELKSVLDLVRVTGLFYTLQFRTDNTRKCMIEIRPEIQGTYKGLIFCRGFSEAKEVKQILDLGLLTVNKKLSSKIKRGCSEFPFVFPDYGKLDEDETDHMQYPRKWKSYENEYDRERNDYNTNIISPSLAQFCLSDFLVIQRWIDYAKGIDDPSSEFFTELPIRYSDTYETAKSR